MRHLLPLLLLPATLAAQAAPLTRADSALVRAVLTAEDRRDARDPALKSALGHADPRIRTIAARAAGRIADSLFAGRDSLPPVPPPTVWPEPAWRLRYRALVPDAACAAVKPALADSAWPVRLRAAALVGKACTGDAEVIAALRGWLAPLPGDLDPRPAGGITWHAAAAALPALARLDPAEARQAVPRFIAFGAWPLRRAAARAAAVLGDTVVLRRLASDTDGNVQEASVEALSRLGGHGEDPTFVAVIRTSRHPQAVRAAAEALKGSPSREAVATAAAVYRRWNARAVDSERDVRVALRDAGGLPPRSDRPYNARPALPADVVPLALGADARLRVTMADGGGGAFVVRLRGDVAPIMAARILDIARRHGYDGLAWHRVEHDFVIQGLSAGDNEYVGAATYLRDELGPIPHPRGTVGMSTRGHDTGDTQWFVNLKDNPRLLRDFTVFAEVVEGMDVVDGVMELDRVERIEVVR